MTLLHLCHAAEQRSVELLSATDSAQLKAVFFSGEPWLVQCGTKADLSAAIVDDGFAAHAVIEKALPALPNDLKVGLLDCYRKLPSGKTAAERFKLDTTVTPVLVLAANGKTVQITSAMLSKQGLGKNLFPNLRNQAGSLAALVKAKSEPKAYAATSSEHIQTICMKRKHCAVVLMEKEPRGEKARALLKMLHEFRTVGFVTINTARYEFSLSKHLPAPTDGVPQLVALRTKPSADGDKKKVQLSAKAHRGDFTEEALREFLSSLTAEELQMTPLKKVPQVRWRKQDTKEAKKDKKDSKESKASKDKAGQQKRREPPRMGGGRKPTKGRQQGGPSAAELEEQRRERETERREQMIAEEDEAISSMYADADEDEDGGEAESEGEGGAGSDEEEEVMDFDDAEGGDGGHDEL